MFFPLLLSRIVIPNPSSVKQHQVFSFRIQFRFFTSLRTQSLVIGISRRNMRKGTFCVFVWIPSISRPFSVRRQRTSKQLDILFSFLTDRFAEHMHEVHGQSI